MTISRAPGSIEQALDKIAGEPLLGGWAGMTTIVGRAESTVRNWANPTTEESIPLALALQLDLAWQRAGMTGAPLRDAYNALADQLREAEYGCQIELARTVARLAKETGEAQEAATIATLPGANEEDFARADRELGHVATYVQNTMSVLRRLRRARPPP